MMNQSKISVKYGMRIAFALIAYFLLMKIIGLLEVYWLRLFNGVIMAYGIYRMLKELKKNQQEHFSTLEAFFKGMKTGVIATFIFVIFLAIYVSILDPGFSERILQIAGWDTINSVPTVLFMIIVEGISSSLILSFVFIPAFKISNNIAQNN